MKINILVTSLIFASSVAFALNHDTGFTIQNSSNQAISVYPSWEYGATTDDPVFGLCSHCSEIKYGTEMTSQFLIHGANYNEAAIINPGTSITISIVAPDDVNHGGTSEARPDDLLELNFDTNSAFFTQVCVHYKAHFSSGDHYDSAVFTSAAITQGNVMSAPCMVNIKGSTATMDRDRIINSLGVVGNEFTFQVINANFLKKKKTYISTGSPKTNTFMGWIKNTL